MRHPAGRRVAFSLIGLAASAAMPSVERRPQPASVVLITLDTTRADRLPPAAGAVDLPAIARLAREGVVFDQAMTPAPLTLPAHGSLLTGRLPPSHGARVNATTLDATAPTVAGSLRTAGYLTAAFVSSVVLDADRGLARGFDTYREVNAGASQPAGRRYRRPANEVLDEAIDWLDANDRSPFFVWIHLYDAHAPYDLPEPHRSMYAGDPYAGALAFMDSQIARLMDVLDRRRLSDRTALVLAADHGESLGEHGERGHGIFVYESVLHVPLIVRWPGVAPRRVANLVRLIDVAPTLLALEGLPAPPMDGISLVPLLRGADGIERDGYAESEYPRQFGWSGLRSFRAGRFKVIEAPRPELYDLEVDPHEQRNLYPAQQATAEALLARLGRSGAAKSGADRDQTADVRERLGALGYIATSRQARQAAALEPDPKDVIELYDALVERMGAYRRPLETGGFAARPASNSSSSASSIR